MVVDSLLAQIENGRAGHSQGISMGLPKLEGIIDGVTRQTYSIVFGQSSTGKILPSVLVIMQIISQQYR